VQVGKHKLNWAVRYWLAVENKCHGALWTLLLWNRIVILSASPRFYRSKWKQKRGGQRKIKPQLWIRRNWHRDLIFKHFSLRCQTCVVLWVATPSILGPGGVGRQREVRVQIFKNRCLKRCVLGGSSSCHIERIQGWFKWSGRALSHVTSQNDSVAFL